jgi:signal peptidase I
MEYMKLLKKLHLRKETRNDVTPVKSGWKNISGTVMLIVAAPILALVLTAHIFQSYEVDGASMETTLQDGDRLIVNKLPKTIANIANSTYLPDRLDVIIFDRPMQSSISKDVDHLIKRVIALPGERVTVSGGKVTVYNQEFPDGFNPDKGQEYIKTISSTEGEVDITVGPGEVFVLGDNRYGSRDSRSFGSITTKTIVGTADFRFVPVNGMKNL